MRVLNRLRVFAYLGGSVGFLLACSPVQAACPTWAGVPVLQPVIPCDSLGTNQNAFNNLAWQQFITLNWAADPNAPGQPDTSVPASSFGVAGSLNPVVWESYKESSEVFRPNGAPPLPWSSKQAIPLAMRALMKSKTLKATSALGIKSLYHTSKFTGTSPAALKDIAEAGTNGAWLTAQPKMNNYVTLFEKRLNQDEYNYINQNQLYIASKQPPFATTQGLNLPDGPGTFVSYSSVGAIEIKAAWIELDDPTLWPMFKTSKAWVSYPITGGGSTPPKQVTVGLVALHIIRKTPNAQQFMWSTFEHVYNAPSKNELSAPPLPWYTYYNLSCDPATDYYKCVQNKMPVLGTDPYNAPVQVVRTTPISNTTANNIAALNTNTWATIKAANPNSVFLNYQLVNVLWPNSNTPIYPGATSPLPDGNAQPPVAQQPVANTVLETYHQDINCLSCHTGATVAGQKQTLASDYSFLFGEASNPTTQSKKSKSKLMRVKLP
ncbi:hypothetical protein [Iodobacter fluviatilis]|uniref:Cytochrome c family protein n=1 Tax=Iodobacter fluviatilis TaxID=537 RepID=A0A377QA25_9NEIS|nr:hypothetical protein [Iodobacter fluviatilis]TCU88490.1 hypothetical protein EV682_10373 [Iodobacter fluviatilis]STQ91439.1 Uncharacterised protein [Iodobacter fluviatilis]